MVKTELTDSEREALLDRIANWAVRLGIAPMVTFLLECNRPVAPLSANVVIAIGPMMQPLLPLPMPEIGLLLLDPDLAREVRRRVTVLEGLEAAS